MGDWIFISSAARMAGVDEATIRKAIANRVIRSNPIKPNMVDRGDVFRFNARRKRAAAARYGGELRHMR